MPTGPRKVPKGQLLLPRYEGQEDEQQLVGPETQAEVGSLH